MKKNSYIALALAVVVLSGALHVAFGHSAFARVEVDDESKLKGRFGEDFKDLDRGFSKIFERFSNTPPAEAPASILVNPDGDVRLTGAEVTAISGPQITVKLWGWNFTVDHSNARIIGRINLPAMPAIDAAATPTAPSANFNIGDKLMVKGTVNSSTGVIAASWVRNLSLQHQGVADIQGRINQLLQLLQQLQAQLRARAGGGN